MLILCSPIGSYVIIIVLLGIRLLHKSHVRDRRRNLASCCWDRFPDVSVAQRSEEQNAQHVCQGLAGECERLFAARCVIDTRLLLEEHGLVINS